MEKIFKGKAETRALGRDLFWEFRFIDDDNHFEFVKIKWTGYNDSFWWNNVSTTEQARFSKGTNGKTYYIDFNTNDVWEVKNED